MKVLIVGVSCNPYASSEPGLTWNWAFHMSDHCTVHLITHPLKRAEINRFLEEHPKPNLRIHYVEVSSRLNYYDPERGERGIRLHYLLWLQKAMACASALHRAEGLDLVHHVGWGTVSVPSPFWKLGVPLVWGPLGGGQTPPGGLIALFGPSRWKERVRTLRIRALPFAPGLRRTIKRSAAILATNRETAGVLAAAGANGVVGLFDNALRSGDYPELPERAASPERIDLLWAGKLIYLKAFELALAAIGHLGTNGRVHLTVAGDGPLKEKCESAVKRLGLQDAVTFLGQVPWEQMPREFKKADAFLFTSLRDSSGSVVVEAASYGLPSVVLDIGGIGTFVPESAAIKIRPSDLNRTATEIAGAILRLRDDVGLRREMGLSARRFAESLSWDKHSAVMWEIYQRASEVQRPE